MSNDEIADVRTTSPFKTKIDLDFDGLEIRRMEQRHFGFVSDQNHRRYSSLSRKRQTRSRSNPRCCWTSPFDYLWKDDQRAYRFCSRKERANGQAWLHWNTVSQWHWLVNQSLLDVYLRWSTNVIVRRRNCKDQRFKTSMATRNNSSNISVKPCMPRRSSRMLKVSCWCEKQRNSIRGNWTMVRLPWCGVEVASFEGTNRSSWTSKSSIGFVSVSSWETSNQRSTRTNRWKACSWMISSRMRSTNVNKAGEKSSPPPRSTEFPFLVWAPVKIAVLFSEKAHFSLFQRWPSMMVIDRNVYRPIWFRWFHFAPERNACHWDGKRRAGVFFVEHDTSLRLCPSQIIIRLVSFLGSTGLFRCPYLWINGQTRHVGSHELDRTRWQCHGIHLRI